MYILPTKGTLHIDDGVGTMIALDSDNHVLNGHVTTSQHLISSESPTTVAANIDMTTLLSSSPPAAIPVTTIVTSSQVISAVTAAVKNEPEDLTGQRRDSTVTNTNRHK